MNKTKKDAIEWWGKISTLDKFCVMQLSGIDTDGRGVHNISQNRIEKIYKNIFSIT